MKHKLKKWHIALMSFLALFISIFASLFSLKADTVVDEETPEELVDLYGFGYVNKDNKVIYICNGRDEILKSHLNARQIWERIQKTREEPYKERNILYCLFFNAK